MQVASPQGTFEVCSKLCGRFNAQNILAAVAAALAAGLPIAAITQGVASLTVVPGRFENVENTRGITARVDFAHKPDALQKVLTTARELTQATRGRLIVVFGCGGDRDRQKRPLMGRAAGDLADVVIVTSDNPRTEEPVAIIEEILPGVRSSMRIQHGEAKCEVIPERETAIARSVECARPGDVLVIAGKGHENYQIVGTTRRHFDDREMVAKYLNA